MSKPIVLFKSLDDDALIPQRYSVYAAGFDLHALEDGFVHQGEIVLVATGVAASIPLGYEGQIRARSGQVLRQGLAVANAPGTIDSDYRGEIKVMATCLYRKAATWKAGDRIAQLVIAPVARCVAFETHLELDTTPRGSGGFGSTGR